MSLAAIGVVLENKQIVPGIFDMSIRWEGADQCLPGQFVNILCEGGGALLRRPISVCDAGRDLLRIVYEVKGTGTALPRPPKQSNASSKNTVCPLPASPTGKPSS